MQQEIRLKNLSSVSREAIEALVASLARERLGRQVPAAESNAARLLATVEKVPARQLYRATLRLEILNRIFFCRDEGEDIESAAENAFSGLEQRVRRHLNRIEQQDFASQPRATQRLVRLGERLRQPLPADRREVFERAQHCLQGLADFVERELIYLRSSGELSSDYPTVDDVVDEALVRALDAWQQDAEPAAFESLLHQLSISVLAERVAEARTELLKGLAVNETAALDPAQALYSQEQIVEPDPGRFDSLVSAASAWDPAEVVEFEQIRRLLFETLRLLPASWRRIVMLSQMDDNPPEMVAAALGIDEHTVQACLEHADAFLRDRLRQAAIELPDRAAPADYLIIEPPFSPVASEIERELSDLLRASGNAGAEPGTDG